ncbi:Uncharacterised protein (plasmid) [Legionella adelaidensis]|uniref:Uncharacterized protein n=1 Tax=Legionella adelaidensis TaxID=45056 RepID=A0A0W0R0Z8_9GAMM|nr:hypothetical protein [Legionella adelaidensis]KTC64725.1 hypothetical protein Lade_2019 [Legionella adelaidensis]VEH82863.1 Uncharacterised protein [Legionella adelaidensis]
MKKWLIILLLFPLPSGYAIEMHNAVVLDHKSEITGEDDKGHAVNGHIAISNEKNFSMQEKLSNNISLNTKKKKIYPKKTA